jgi:L,D-transpeptidase catalytic domain
MSGRAAAGLNDNLVNAATSSSRPGSERAMTRLVVAALMVLLCGLSRAEAGVVITVDKTAQRLSVSVDGVPRYNWPISTARMGYRTPNGVYRPQRLERQWYSRKYDWSPMPHSIFFHGGYAIHGSYEISRIGTPASHGCIRLYPQNAATLYALVQAHMRDTEIVVTGAGPGSAPEARAPAWYEGPDARAPRYWSGEPYTPPPRRWRPLYDRSFEDIFDSAGDADVNAAIARKRWENLQ